MTGTTLVDLTTVGAASTPALRHLSRIVQAATARPAGRRVRTAVRCRRRPGRQPCVGFIEVRRQDLPDLVQWSCAHCGDAGVARNWRGSPWRLHAPRADGSLAITLPESAYRLLEFNAPADDQAQQVVRGAMVDADGIIRLDGGVDTLQRLQRHLASLGRRGADERIRSRARAAARAFASSFSRLASRRGEPRRG